MGTVERKLSRPQPVRTIGSRGGPSGSILRLLEISPFVFAGLAVVLFFPASWELRLIGLGAVGGLALFRAYAEVRGFPAWIQTVVPPVVAVSIGVFIVISASSLLIVLLFFNCLRVAFFESRRVLVYTLVATTLTLLAGAIIHPDELAVRGGIWMVVMPAICIPIQSRSQTVRDRVGLNAKLAAVLADLLTSDDARRSLVNAAGELGDADIAVIYEPQGDGTTEAVAARGIDPDEFPRVKDESSIVAQVMASGETIFVPYLDSLEGAAPPGFAGSGIESIICCPILRDEKPIAALCAGWCHRVRRDDHVDPTVIKLLASEAAVTIDHSDLMFRLADTAATDPLTGLPNRRAWDRLLQAGLLESRQVEKPFSIAILDLDHFKQYNDSHGHQAGDRLLREAAAAWKSVLRKGDMIFRWGGEEFTVILPHCDQEEAIEVSERLRAATPGSQTSSAGIATWNGRESADALFARTDAALYQAKESGRDRTVSAGGPVN